MYYVQRMVGRNKATLETVDEFETRKEAQDARYEYCMADRSAVYYISGRPCKAWAEAKNRVVEREATMNDTMTTARHCLNRCCPGPEWWAFFDKSTEEYRPCPSCGYPCSIEFILKDKVTPEAICAAIMSKTK